MHGCALGSSSARIVASFFPTQLPSLQLAPPPAASPTSPETLDMVTGSVTALMPNVGARAETTHARKVDTWNLRSAQELLLFIFFPLIYSSVTDITNDPKTLARPSMSIVPSHDRMTTSKHKPWSVR
jgi:hypothetical protein